MNFFKNLSIYGLVPVISKSIGFLLIPLYTNYLSVAEFGIQDIYTVFISLLVFFVALEIHSGVGRYFFEFDNESDRKSLISTAFTFQIIMSVVALIILFFLDDFLYDKLIGIDGYKSTYWLAILWLPFSAMIGFFSVIIRYENKAKEYLKITIVQLFIRLILTVLCLVYYKLGVPGIFIAQLLGSIIACFSYYFLLKDKLKLTLDPYLLKSILKYALPIVPGLLIIGFEPNITRYLIREKLDVESVGIFALSIKIISFFSILGTALKMTWEPFIFEISAKNNSKLDSKVLSVFNFFLILLFLGVFVISIFSREVVSVIAPQIYYDSYKIIGFLSIAAALNIVSTICSIGINFAKKTSILSGIVIIYELVIISLVAIFLGKFGLLSVSIAYILGSLIRVYASIYFTNKYMGLDFPKIKIFSLIIFTTLLNIVLINYDVPIPVKALLIATVLIIAILSKNKIRNTIQIIRN